MIKDISELKGILIHELEKARAYYVNLDKFVDLIKSVDSYYDLDEKYSRWFLDVCNDTATVTNIMQWLIDVEIIDEKSADAVWDLYCNQKHPGYAAFYRAIDTVKRAQDLNLGDDDMEILRI